MDGQNGSTGCPASRVASRAPRASTEPGDLVLHEHLEPACVGVVHHSWVVLGHSVSSFSVSRVAQAATDACISHTRTSAGSVAVTR